MRNEIRSHLWDSDMGAGPQDNLSDVGTGFHWVVSVVSRIWLLEFARAVVCRRALFWSPSLYNATGVGRDWCGSMVWVA